MIPLYTPAQVRDLDRRAFDRGVAPLDLMERAAGHLARGVVDVAGRGYGLRVAVLAGKGNNGGDGIAAARLLLDAGAATTVCLVAGDDGLSDDCAEQLRRWRRLGGRVTTDLDAALSRADVAVDCLLGTGASGAPRSPYREAIAALDAHAGLPVVACDIPSGVDADTGAVPGDAVSADLTVTLGAHKRGLWLWPARGHCGEIVLGDLGIVEPDDEPAAALLDDTDLLGLLPAPPPDAEKRERGVVLAVAGSAGMTGAATLVARGALAAGAGLVVVAVRGGRELVAPTVPEALTLDLPDDPDAAWEVLAPQLAAADAVAVGPGIGRTDEAIALARRLVRDVDVPVVLDADGLNAFRHEGDLLSDHATPLLVATPHERELLRLLGGGHDDAWARRADTVAERAKAWRAVVVAKGPGSLVAGPDGRAWVNPTGGPALATGGTGDVLTGMLAALAAADPRAEVTAAGVYLHGLAGQLAGEGLAARAATALDVADAIPDALALLEELAA